MALIHRFRLSPPLLCYILFGLVVMVIIENLGYNLFVIRLTKRYPSLMPCFNCMQAPATLYLYYALVAAGFYLSMIWIGAAVPPVRSGAAGASWPIRN